MPEVKRYHPVLISLHWLLAIVILGLFFLGLFVLDEMKSTDPQKAGLLVLHIIGGIAVLVLTVVRLIVRMRTPRPAPIVTGKPLADKLAVGIHHLLYTLTILAALVGLVLTYSADLFSILFAHTGKLPEDFEDYLSHEAHGLLANGLIAIIALHIAGALQHQFILKDNIMSRISLFGAKD
ncbi:MAG: cytochrome b [Nitrosomonadales bacterium]|nr:cytochrome b [Nitrosomonadales bacterium]